MVIVQIVNSLKVNGTGNLAIDGHKVTLHLSHTNFQRKPLILTVQVSQGNSETHDQLFQGHWKQKPCLRVSMRPVNLTHLSNLIGPEPKLIRTYGCGSWWRVFAFKTQFWRVRSQFVSFKLKQIDLTKNPR